jgi:hypothetical protein
VSIAVNRNSIETGFCGRLAENDETIDPNFQGKALAHCGKSNDDPALLAQLRHDALDPGKDTIAHANARSNADVCMGTQRQAARQSIANLGQFFVANHVPFVVSKEVEHAGSGDDGDSVFGSEAREDISGEERPLGDHGSVSPLYALRVEREIIFDGTHNKVLRDFLFMVRKHM